ncbi:MAG TPA: 4'-phosphopantetheinyl transferase superfamily protein [Prolixibacteraceae bacterium]|nr:4'-phosphopantetheinyl transferase superfamily protein [Prolixibacteraceae bacterium]
MPQYKTITIPGGLIGVWQLTESSDDLLAFFTPEELSDPNFQKYTFEKRKIEWLAIRVLIKQLIGSDFTISYSESGKPMLNHAQFKHLSISHSRDFVTIFIHEQFDVGLDVENITRNFTAVKKRYLSENELEQVGENPRLQCLYWCAKEAIFKLVPDEGVEFKHQILISPFNSELEDTFSARFKSTNRDSIYQLHFQTFSDHCLVWLTGETLQ